MTTLQRAIEIAVDAHKNQTQKNGLPYVLHPLSLTLSMKSDNERIAAVLHDVVKDLNRLKKYRLAWQTLNT
ncbi:hypothetical protein N9383_04530 [Granulosicoccus sp.]|nr:hypothetical protein [Granulosicoccus sp.]